MQIAIIDYGLGNLRSVTNAFNALGCLAQIVTHPEDLNLAEKIVLPGVGAFGDGMQNLQAGGWVQALEEQVQRKGKPFLGLCLGLQLLATTGTEHGVRPGLNWVSGVVERIQVDDSTLRVPHIGWNDVRLEKTDGLYAGLADPQTFYFVHSYILRPDNPQVISGVCRYGIEFAASIEIDNIWATQYHPEKSQKAGRQVLENFLKRV